MHQRRAPQRSVKKTTFSQTQVKAQARKSAPSRSESSKLAVARAGDSLLDPGLRKQPHPPNRTHENVVFTRQPFHTEPPGLLYPEMAVLPSRSVIDFGSCAFNFNWS